MPYVALEAANISGGVFVLHLFCLVQKRALFSEEWLGKGRHYALNTL